MKNKEIIIKNTLLILNIILFYYLLFIGWNKYAYDMNYLKCKESSNFYPFTLEDEGKIIGHIILRNTGENNE